LQRGWAPPDPRTWAMEDLDSLLSSATSLTQGLVPAAEGGDEASDADAASSSAPEADPLLAVNISTSSSVDAANLQRVLTFLVSSVQSLAHSCATSEAREAEAERKHGAVAEQLQRLQANFDSVSARVGGLADDDSSATGLAKVEAAVKENEERLQAKIAELETQLSEQRAETEAALSAQSATSGELASAQKGLGATVEGLESAVAAAAEAAEAASSGLATSEASLGERLDALQQAVDGANSDNQREMQSLRDFVSSGLKAASEGREVPTAVPDPGAGAAEALMKCADLHILAPNFT